MMMKQQNKFYLEFLKNIYKKIIIINIIKIKYIIIISRY